MDAPYEVLTNLLRFALQFLSDKQKKQFKMAACVVVAPAHRPGAMAPGRAQISTNTAAPSH
jgi:hypothetical protein